MRDTIVVVVVRPCVVPLSNSHSNRSLPASGTHRPSRPSRYPPTSSAERSGMHEPPTHVFVWMDGLVICCFFSPRLTRSRRVWYPPRTTPTTSYPCPAEICYDNRNPRQVDRQRRRPCPFLLLDRPWLFVAVCSRGGGFVTPRGSQVAGVADERQSKHEGMCMTGGKDRD